MTAGLLVPVIAFFLYPHEPFDLSLAIIGLILTIRHRENLERLVMGTEKKFSFAS